MRPCYFYKNVSSSREYQIIDVLILTRTKWLLIFKTLLFSSKTTRQQMEIFASFKTLINLSTIAVQK